MIGRRGILGALAGGAVGGPAVARSIGRAIGQTGNGPPTTPYPMNEAFGNLKGCDQPTAPLMERAAAWTRVLGNVFLRDQVRASLYEQYRHSTEIYPDLLILKSLSPMAKIALSRQRRVEQELTQVFAPEDNSVPEPYSPARHFLEQHVQQLMWG